MYFCTLYPNFGVGYTVNAKMLDEDGCVRFHPLRSFAERQGDALCFQIHDCPKMSETAIRGLIRSYDGRPYKRIENPDTGTVRFEHLEENECLYYSKGAEKFRNDLRGGKTIF